MSELAPGFLVAAPPLGDPNFDRSVVLLAAHGEDGAFGWILNGREVMSLSDLILQAELSTSPLSVAGNVRVGGPVSGEQVWLLYRAEERFDGVEGQFEVSPGLVACASRKVLELLADGARPESLFALAGYAGWAPGQLEREIRVGALLPTELDLGLIFDGQRETLWHRAYEHVGFTPIAFTSRVGLA